MRRILTIIILLLSIYHVNAQLVFSIDKTEVIGISKSGDESNLLEDHAYLATSEIGPIILIHGQLSNTSADKSVVLDVSTIGETIEYYSVLIYSKNPTSNKAIAIEGKGGIVYDLSSLSGELQSTKVVWNNKTYSIEYIAPLSSADCIVSCTPFKSTVANIPKYESKRRTAVNIAVEKKAEYIAQHIDSVKFTIIPARINLGIQ